MPKLIILPHPGALSGRRGPEGATGETILDIALRKWHRDRSTLCEKSCACTPATYRGAEGFDPGSRATSWKTTC